MKSILRIVLICMLALIFCTAAAGESVSLPGNLQEIQEEAFADCESLSGVLVIPRDIQVAQNAFSNTPDLTVLRGVAVVGDESTPWNGTLDWDVRTAVSAYCEARNLDFTYTTDAANALQDGYDVIITVGFMASDAVGSLQTQYPDVRFICLDSELENQQDNVYCVLYNTEQSGFMAGYAAVRMGYRSLGFLGGMQEVFNVVAFGNGFIKGANQAAVELGITDEVTVARAYTGTFAPDNAVYQKAVSWYDKGAEIIFCCGGDMCQSVIRAANEKNGKMIGVDTDQSNLGSAVVTSAMKNMGFTATDALDHILAGNWSSIGGTCPRLGVISAAPSDNHVCLAPSTQFNSGFSASAYATMVAKLNNGTYPSGTIQITVTSEPVAPVLPRVAVVGDESTPWNGTLDWDVKTAVSAYCEARNLDFTYTTDAADALQDGYDVIITVGFMASDAVGSLQTQYPDVRFICLDSELENQQDNVYCVLYNTEQSGFMAGYAAVRMGYRSLGFLGGMQEVFDVVAFGNGFIKGANQAAVELGITDEVTVARAYTGTFAPDNAVYQKAVSWYDKGAEIIFCCGGDMCQSVIRAANEKNGKMIGVDTDQSNLGSAVVTSAMKNMGFSATDALDHILGGNWSSIGGTCPRLGVISETPSENHVCLAPNTQFNSGFSSSDYAIIVGKLYDGTYPSGAIQITVTSEPTAPVLPRVAVVGDESTPWNGTLDWDVRTAVSAYCETRNLDFTYTTDAAGALQDGYDVIITVGFMASDAVGSLQAQYPDVGFICLDSEVGNQQDNVYCVLYDTEQSGFMAGYAAVRMGYRSLGFLGGMQEVSDVVNFGNGFIKGANQAAVELGIVGDVTVLRAYTGTFAPDDVVYQKAVSWYNQGVEIIFCCGGNMCDRVIEAANDKNGKMIGVDTDQSNLGSAVVTSAMKNMGFSATDALDHILTDQWDSIGGTCPRLGVISTTPSENHVCLAPNTQFNSGFSSSDYANVVAKLYDGTYPSGAIQISVTTE